MSVSRWAAVAFVLFALATNASLSADINAPPGQLSVALSDADITRSALFGALAPVGGKTDLAENEALAAALSAYSQGAYLDGVEPITAYLAKHPNSAWNTSLLLNLGTAYRNTGHFSLAAPAWQQAWAQSRELADLTGKAVADAALGKLAEYYAFVGDEQRLSNLLDSAQGRSLTGAATEEVSNAKIQLATMRKAPEYAFRCGAAALEHICLLKNVGAATGKLFGVRAEARGISLSQLLQLSATAGLQYQMAYRERGAEIPTPAVINWKVGHYGTIADKSGDLYRASDRLDRDIWVRPVAIDEEASGYFLIPEGALPAGWRKVDAAEGENVWGRGPVEGFPDGPGPTDPQGFPPPCDNGGGGSGGMTTYNVAAATVSLELHDRLLSYKPALGRAVTFDIFYNQRDTSNDQWASLYTNFGPKWTSNWISWIDDRDTVWNEQRGGQVYLFLPGGGLETYHFSGPNTESDPGLLTQARLSYRQLPAHGGSSVVVVGGPRNPPTTSPATEEDFEFVRDLPDGSSQIFALSAPAQSPNQGRHLLTQVIDPQGNTISLTYDSMMRITAITDATGQATTLEYNLPADPRKVTAVIDPFGRRASLVYSADGSHLVKAIDPGGMTSAYTWSANDFISQLTTPYGTTTFATDDHNSTWPTLYRSLTITDPAGLVSRVDQHEAAPGVPSREGAVPQIAGVDFSTANGYLNYRDVYVWDPHQLSLATQTLNTDGSPDYTKARNLHFLHSDLNTGSFVLESIKNPLENRVWFLYPNQTQGTAYVGSSNQPIAIARVLDDGTTQKTTLQRNDFGHITQITDPVGRQFTFQYVLSNEIDLTAVIAGTSATGQVLFSAGYNVNHQLVSIADAAAKRSTLSYDPTTKQLSSFTNALNQTVSYIYDPSSHRLSAVQVSPDNSGPINQVAVTYDGYGRPSTITDDLGYMRAITYDVYDRPITVTFPDGTTESWTYHLLDLQNFTDRMGRTTSYAYDPDRRLKAITGPPTASEPLGRTTQFTYCLCGAISTISDPAGNTTTFNYDANDRILTRQYADGSLIDYAYETATSRLKSVRDHLTGRGSSYTYNADNTLSTVGDPAKGGMTTVQFVYDPVFVRLMSMTDSFGTTSYTYYPVATPAGPASPGALRLQTETSPFGDTIFHTYDAVGRETGMSIDGVASSQTFDSIGRVSVVNNPLGIFSYSYLGASRRVTKVSSSAGPDEQITYYDATGDYLPQQVTWVGPPGPSAPPTKACIADNQAMQNISAEIQQDQASLAQWCSDALSQQCQQNGPSERSLINNLRSDYQYYFNQRKVDCAPHPPPVSVLASFSYTYDADNEVRRVTFTGENVNFPANTGAPRSTGTYDLSYDAYGELLTVTPLGGQPGDASYAYAYTPAFNIQSVQNGGTATSYSYDKLDQITTPGFSYDDGGNLSAAGQTRYTWDFAGEHHSLPVDLSVPDSALATVTYPNGSATEFSYDGWGRLTRIRDGNGSDKRYLWCGAQICQEHDLTMQSASQPGGPITKTYFDQGVQLLNYYSYFYTKDRLGSVYQLFGGGNSAAAQYQYDPYGNRVQVAGSMTSDIGYTGLFQHQSSGLALATFRAYSPTIGRWLSRDPLAEFPTTAFRFGATLSSTNAYAYVKNDPLNRADPLGLEWPDPRWWAGFAANFANLAALWGQDPLHITKRPPEPSPPIQTPEPPEPIGPSGGGAGGAGSGGAGGGPGGGAIEQVGGWFTWVPGSLCTPFIFINPCTLDPTLPGCLQSAI